MHFWRMAVAFLIPALGACVYSHGDNGGPPPPNNTQPVTVVVDTNQTMKAQGGQGVGVFVEYAAGGHWHVYWTCDTSLSGLPCDFSLVMSGKSIANPKATNFEPSTDSFQSTADGALSVITHTTTGLDGIDFDATPGADMKIDLTVSGLRDGRFFFFVQNGQVDGNFQGTLSDPLIFEPSTP